MRHVVGGAVDFVLAFAVVHELPHTAAFIAQLVSEPRRRVSPARFDATLRAAGAAGLRGEGLPALAGGRPVLRARAGARERAA